MLLIETLSTELCLLVIFFELIRSKSLENLMFNSAYLADLYGSTTIQLDTGVGVFVLATVAVVIRLSVPEKFKSRLNQGCISQFILQKSFHQS